MKRIIPTLAVALALIAPTAQANSPAKIAFESLPLSKGAKTLQLVGSGDRMQLLVNAYEADGRLRDTTHEVLYSAAPANIISISKDGFIKPKADGSTTITAKLGDKTASLKVTVKEFGKPQEINFANRIVPIFTKGGCNGGGCHGKSGGQN